jgi:uncharacterized membrane protein
MDAEEKLLKLTEIFNNQLDSFHNALSETEKHFTWWILIILGFIVVAFNIQYVQRPFLLFILSLVGIIVSLSGYFVIRKEGRYFVENKKTFNRIANVLDINEELWNIPGAHNEDKAKKDALGVEKNASKKYTSSWEYEEGGNKPFLALIYFSSMNIYSSLIHTASIIGLRSKQKADTMKSENSLNIRDCFQLLYLIFAVVFLLLIGIY